MMKRLLHLGAWVCLCAIHSLSAQTTSPLLDLRVSVQAEEETLLQVFDELQEAYPLLIFFREEWISRDPISLNLQDVPLGKAMDQLLEETDLAYVPYGAHALIVGRFFDIQRLDAFSFEEFVEDVSSLEEEAPQLTERRLVVGDSTLRPRPQTAKLTGLLLDRDTEEPLAGGQLRFPGLQLGTFTDSAGRYSIELPTGSHLVEAESPGHEKLAFQMEVYSDGAKDIALGYTAFQLDEVLLEAGSVGQSLDNAQAGRIQLSMIDIRRTPALMGEVDIINTILLLPGVSTVGESASGFNVRGGNVDQNLIMQDGTFLFNSSHLLGFFSVINPDVVKNVTLYKGHMPAQFGGRLSSVLDIDLIDGSYRTYKGQGSIGLFSSKFALSGPIQYGKNSFVAAVRGAYPNLITRQLRNIENVALSSSYYGDLTLKFTQKLNETGKLSAFGYASTDFFSFSEEFGFEWGTFSGGLEWQQIYSDRFSLTAEASAGRFTSNFFNSDGVTGAANDTGMDHARAKINLQFVPNSRHNINLGGAATYYDTQDNVVSPSGENSALAPLVAEKDQGLELALYANDDFDLNDFVRFSAGLRVSHFRNLGPYRVLSYEEGRERTENTIVDSTSFGAGETVASFWGLEPRLSARVLFDEATSIKLSYNRTYQYMHLLSNTASPTPIDIWQLSNTYFPAQSANNFSIGFFKDFQGKLWQTSLEVFYRDMDGLVVPKDFAQLLGNPHIETEMLNAEGEAYGAEFSVKRNYGKLDLELSVTYARSFRRTVGNPADQHVNDGEWFPSDFDSPINVTLTTKYRPSRTKTLSASFVYRTGRPVSAPAGAFSVYPSWFIPTFTERNQFRIPDYHRLDLAYTFDDGLISRKKLTTEFTFSLYNVYARQNAFSVFFRREGTRFKAFQLAVLGTVLPFFSYNFKF